MQTDIIQPDSENLTYEIRDIVATARRFESLGQEITWENIGDPIAKGQQVPEWVKAHVRDAASEDASYAYSPTRGVLASREFLARQQNEKSGSELTTENILFFNGLGDAISHLYHALGEKVRVIGPDPAYPTHAIAEVAHARDVSTPLTYRLDPEDGWRVDTAELASKLAAHSEIRGILLINPGNPTGGVLDRENLQAVVELAKEYNCFIIADAIYDELRYGAASEARIGEVVGDVPLVVMRGLSKVVPWPGARCGWLEFYNTDVDYWARFRDRLVETKMREVCSTTLPQVALPEIFADERWEAYLAERNAFYKQRADLLAETFADVSGVSIQKPDGAYYASVVFAPGALHGEQTLPVENEQIADMLPELLRGVPVDKRFVYYLLAAEGICVVPLSSGFYSRNEGFRMTLLETDLETFKETLATLRRAITDYLNS